MNKQKVKVKVKSLSRVRLFVTPWTAAHQAPPSMDSPGKSTGVRCHCLLRELPCDPAIPLLGIYSEKMKILIVKDARTPVFIAALFTIAKICKQPKCPWTDKWINKMCRHNWILLSHEKKWNYAICSNMIGSRDYHTKWSKSNRERQIPYDVTYM